MISRPRHERAGRRSRQEVVAALQARATSKGGRLVTRDYQGARSRVELECENGHRWEAFAHNILSAGSWCPRCHRDDWGTTQDRVKKMVAKRGGRIVGGSYETQQSQLAFVCKFGHRFSSRVSNVLYHQSWCPNCAATERADKSRTSIEEIREFVSTRGGICLSESYESPQQKLRFQCADGHQWRTSWSSVHAGSWCPVCRREEGASKKRLGLEIAQAHAADHDGACLSTRYVSSREPLKWRCRKGHVWETTLNSVRSAGTWCPECARQSSKGPREGTATFVRRLSIMDAQVLADKYGGRCLSEHMENGQQSLHWCCADGHEWQASLSSMRSRRDYCASCARKHECTTMLAKIKAFALSNRGLCLDDQYEHTGQPLHWRCHEGHEWTASWNNMRTRKSFCVVCARAGRPVDELHSIAQENSGRCLSTSFTTDKRPYRWQCEEGHVFRASIMQAKEQWCKRCQQKARNNAKGIAKLRRVAETHGGQWLEEPYAGALAKYLFRCKNGHRFRKHIHHAAQHWCGKCKS